MEKKEIIKEIAIYGIATAGIRLVNFILIPIYTRIFTPEEYGTISIVSGITQLLISFSILGLDSASGRFFWDDERKEERKKVISSWFYTNIVSSTISSLLITLLSKHISQFIKKPDISYYIILSSISVPLSIPFTVLQNFTRVKREALLTSTLFIINSILNLSFSIVFALEFHLKGVFLSQIAYNLISAIFSIVFLGNWISPKRFSAKKLKDMIKFSIPLIPLPIFSWLTTYSQQYFIQFFLDTKEVGFYYLGSQIASPINLVVQAFQLGWGPIALSIMKEENAKNIYSKIFTKYVTGILLISAVISLLSEEIITIMSGKEYVPAKDIVGYIAIYHFLSGLIYITAVGIIITKKTFPFFTLSIITSLTSLIFNYILIPKIGKEGGAISLYISQIIGTATISTISQRFYKIQYEKKAIVILLLGIIFIPILPKFYHFVKITLLFFILIAILKYVWDIWNYYKRKPN